jgi:hypothetical protein
MTTSSRSSSSSKRGKPTSAKRSAKAPWAKPAPKGASHSHLSPKKKAAAKRAAKRAGRPYPNLVDNMRAATGPATKGKGK